MTLWAEAVPFYQAQMSNASYLGVYASALYRLVVLALLFMSNFLHVANIARKLQELKRVSLKDVFTVELNLPFMK